MKIVIVLSCVVLLFANVSNLPAQADCGYRIFVDLRNEANDVIKTARLRLGGGAFFYRRELGMYETSGLLGAGAPAWNANLKVSAKGYESFNRELLVSCSRFNYEYSIILRPKRSKLEAEFKVISKEENK